MRLFQGYVVEEGRLFGLIRNSCNFDYKANNSLTRDDRRILIALELSRGRAE